MLRGRKLAPLVLSDEQREQLLSWTRSTSMPQGSVLRARIVLASADGLTNTAVAKRFAISLPTVGKWRGHFLALGVQALHDDGRPGTPDTYDDERVATVINGALYTKPADSTTWSVRLMAGAEGVSKSTVRRWFALFGDKPHLSETFKLSNDPFFIKKVRDVTRPYLNPRTLPSCSASTRRPGCRLWTILSPPWPMGLGYAEGYTHDYLRHGMTMLFATVDVAAGKCSAAESGTATRSGSRSCG